MICSATLFLTIYKYTLAVFLFCKSKKEPIAIIEYLQFTVICLKLYKVPIALWVLIDAGVNSEHGQVISCNFKSGSKE
jgi:hypothetical protein